MITTTFFFTCLVGFAMSADLGHHQQGYSGGNNGGHAVVHGGHGGGHDGGYSGGHATVHHDADGHNKGHQDVYHHAPAYYNFDYAVSDHYGNNYGHQEQRDGYNTKGAYYVNLPDGRLQKVSYYVDKWGYHPTVTYEGVAKFPKHVSGYGH